MDQNNNSKIQDVKQNYFESQVGQKDEVQLNMEGQKEVPEETKYTDLKTYAKYFDITSDMFIQRVACVVMPWKKDFFILIKDKPDLYGPWWICITIVVMIAVSGNLYRYFAITDTLMFHYKFDFLPTAFFSIIAYQIVNPLILYYLFKAFQCPLNYIETVCGIGYSLIPYAIAVFICAIPSGLLQWAALGAATCVSTLFLSHNYNHYLVQLKVQNNRYAVMGFVILSQLFLLFVVKIYFFNNIYQ